MSYPVILYPKLLVDFRREHPLPPERSHDSAAPLGQSIEKGEAQSINEDVVSIANSSHKRRTITMGVVSLGLILGLLGFNEVARQRFPQNFQQPIRVVSFLGAALALTGVAGYAYTNLQKQVGSSSSYSSSPNTQPQPQLASLNNQGLSDAERHERGRLLLDYLELLKANLDSSVIQPAGVSDAPVGRSEDAFATFLERYFPGRVRRQLEFPIPQSEKGRSFSTDFAIVLEEIGLYLDVEIDEPFDLKKKRPTHCIDDYHDRYRNGFFLQGNWIVVRFAEEQVVRYPKSCCREIASVVAQVTGLDKFLKPLASEPILKPIPQWTKKQARAMAKSNYRDTYLPLLNGSTR